MKNFVWPIRVYFEDTDSGGVVYYANYLKYMERGRTEWLRKMGIEQNQLAQEHGVLFMVRSAIVDYRRPGRLDDLLEVHSQVLGVRGASVDFDQSVVRAGARDTMKSMELLCAAKIKIACVHAVTGKPRALPAFVKMELRGGC